MDSLARRQYTCVLKIVPVLFMYMYVYVHVQAMHRGGGLCPIYMYSTKAAR